MPVLDIILDGNNAWPDLAGVELPEVESIAVAGLGHGMESGLASVAIRIDLADGTSIVAQTSLALFLQAARLLAVRYDQAP